MDMSVIRKKRIITHVKDYCYSSKRRVPFISEVKMNVIRVKVNIIG